MRATAQDPDTARLMGIDTNRVIVVTFVIGAALAAVAGVMQGMRFGQIDFRIGFVTGLKAFTAAVLGGIGNISGAVLGRLRPGDGGGHGRAVHAPRVGVEGRVGLRRCSSSCWSSGPPGLLGERVRDVGA